MAIGAEPAAVTPARAALIAAAAERRDTGLELKGFLSEQDGFLPTLEFATSFPESHRAWDEVARELPRLWRDVEVRRAIDDLPLLRGTPEALDDEYVWLAATTFGFLAHSYVRSEIEPGQWPAALEQPWLDVVRRLGRSETFMQITEGNLCNYVLKDPAGPRERPNMEMLRLSIGIPTEANFYLTLLEMHVVAIPLIGAAVRAQEAALAGDREALADELLTMIEAVAAVRDRVLTADPNPYSGEHRYCDPVLWGSIVAPFGVSLKPHIPGPGGTASPIFHLLDAFLGRVDYASILGEEMQRLHKIAPPNTQAFLRGIAEHPIEPLVAALHSRELSGLVATLKDSYAGERGLLAAHRIKAYGYLQIATKVGRPVTVGGFAGSFMDRPWQTVGQALEQSRRERRPDDQALPHHASITRRTPAAPAAAQVKELQLDVAGEGVVYRPGDQIGVLFENEQARVDRTLAVLGATGEEPISLTPAWQVAVRGRPGRDGAVTALPLAELLRFAQLRPCPRETVKRLHKISDAGALRDILERRSEDQWELSGLLAQMRAAGYDLGRLLLATAGQEESLAAIVPPSPARLYSISSAPEHGDRRPADSIRLTVGTLEFDTGPGGPEPAERHRGAASVYLNEGDMSQKVAARIFRPAAFRLPADRSRPIVMFAGGTGISPFRGFLEQLAGNPAQAPVWLIFSARTREEFLYREVIEQLVADGRLNLAAVFTRDDAEILAEAGTPIRLVPGGGRRVTALMREQPLAGALWELIEQRDAAVYICGQGGFASGVMDGLRRLIAERSGRPDAGVARVREMIGTQRLMLDVFTNFAPLHGPASGPDRVVDASELVLHNDAAVGRWMAIDGAVYDLTEFEHLHPGGRHIIHATAGIDAGREWRAVDHHRNPGVASMLAMYRIGSMRRLELSGSWGVAMLPEGMAYYTLDELYRRWVRFLFLLTEMQGSFANDVQYLPAITTVADPESGLTPMKLMLFGNTHARFRGVYYATAFGEELERIWALTVGLASSGEDVRWMRRQLDEVEASDTAARSEAVAELINHAHRTHDPEALETRALVERIKQTDSELIDALKARVRDGIIVFERHGKWTLERGGRELIDVLSGLPQIARDYHAKLAAAAPEASLA